MRHPVWSLASWLGLGVVACAHGGDSLASPAQRSQLRGGPTAPTVTVGPFSRGGTVAANRESRSNSSKTLTRIDAPARPLLKLEAPPSPQVVSQLPQSSPVKVASPFESVALRNVGEAGSVPSPVSSSEIAETSVPLDSRAKTNGVRAMQRTLIPADGDGTFAEFEREVPQHESTSVTKTSEPRKLLDDSALESPEFFPEVTPARTAPANVAASIAIVPDANRLPLIVPAGRAEPALPRSGASVVAVSSSNSSEATIVTDASATRPSSESKPRVQDVAKLVDQVFDDLRQHRIQQAQQRAARLRQMVTKCSSPTEMTDRDAFDGTEGSHE